MKGTVLSASILIIVLGLVFAAFAITVLPDRVKSAAVNLAQNSQSVITEHKAFDDLLKQIGTGTPTPTQSKALAASASRLKSLLLTSQQNAQALLSAVNAANLKTSEFDAFVSGEVSKVNPTVATQLTSIGGETTLLNNLIQNISQLNQTLDKISSTPPSDVAPRSRQTNCANITTIITACGAGSLTGAACTNAENAYTNLRCIDFKLYNPFVK